MLVRGAASPRQAPPMSAGSLQPAFMNEPSGAHRLNTDTILKQHVTHLHCLTAVQETSDLRRRLENLTSKYKPVDAVHRLHARSNISCGYEAD